MNNRSSRSTLLGVSISRTQSMDQISEVLTRRRISRRTLLQAALGAVLVGTEASLPFGASSVLADWRKQFVFAWLVPYDPASFASLRQHADVITHVSPTWYIMDGDLSISGQADQAVTQFARDRGIQLVPLIKNKQFSPSVAHDILATSQRRARAAEKIASLVLQNHYDGINIDFEGHFGASRDRFSDFLARLAVRLRLEGKLLTVDVVPQLKPAAMYPNTSGAAPYDYAALGHVCDAVMVMCYSYSDRRPGSLSPLWWLRDATSFARTQIPAHKLVVGMAFYGRHWVVNSSQVTHTDLKQDQVLALLAQSGAHVTRPAPDYTPRFTWEDAAGMHIVHFEDATSLEAKLKVVRAAGAQGATFWRLGQEAASQWKVIKLELG
jgi:spore germination protein